MLLLLLLLLLTLCSAHSPYGSKAPYHLVAGNLSDVTFPCTPVSIFAVHRHGVRNIGDKVIKRIDMLVDGLRARYASDAAMPATLNWILDFKHAHKPNRDLILEGYQDLHGQGRRFGATFPDIFHNSRDTNRFSSSYKGRCISSAISYLHGMYGTNYRIDNAARILDVEDIQRDCDGMCHVYGPLMNESMAEPLVHFQHQQNNLLRYYKDCKNYVVKLANKATWQAAPNSYLKSIAMVRVTKQLSGRLNIVISPYDAVTLHILCALEVLVPRLMFSSQWCSVFESDGLYDTAYYLDLTRYAGKMMPEAVASSCVLLQDGLTFLNSTRGANVKFAHTETLFPLLEHIGYLTEPMVPGVRRLKRQFFGDITPLGSNFVLVAMQCEGELHIQALLNEIPVELPNCLHPCKLETLLELYPPESCDMELVCEGGMFTIVELVIMTAIVICILDLLRRKLFM